MEVGGTKDVADGVASLCDSVPVRGAAVEAHHQQIDRQAVTDSSQLRSVRESMHMCLSRPREAKLVDRMM